MLREIERKIQGGARISSEEALRLFDMADPARIFALAGMVRERTNGKQAFYNRNIHVEPTNICVRQCRFCSYYRKEGEPGSWDMNAGEILQKISENPDISEVHITGGLHPSKDLAWYTALISSIRYRFPNLHIKALTAEEIDYLCRKARVSVEDGLDRLKAAGLGSLPGGGAEIFHPEVRREICPEKITGDQWLSIHETAHRLGLASNATMLFGHIESPYHRIHHMERLRDLQDRSRGFNAFIPLKYKSAHNELSTRGETGMIDVLKTYALARIFLDNITHLKAYWPMLGKENAALMLSFGADDLDGTIHDSTRIYTMAGSEEKTPVMDPRQIEELIKREGFVPVERNSLYQPVS